MLHQLLHEVVKRLRVSELINNQNSYNLLVQVWDKFVEVRNLNINEMDMKEGIKKTICKVLSNLPFVNGTESSFDFKKFYTDELPSETFSRTTSFIEGLLEEKIDPKHIKDQDDQQFPYKIMSSIRQDIRLLGFLNEFNEVNVHLLESYRAAEDKNILLKELLKNQRYFRMILICLDLIRECPKNVKRKLLEQLGMLIVYNSMGDNLMVESVAKGRTRNLLLWLEATGLVNNEWIPNETYFDTFLVKEQAMDTYIKRNLVKVLDEYLEAKKEGIGGHPLRAFVRNDIPREFNRLPFIDSTKYLVTASAGHGEWAAIPWIAIMNRHITTSTQRGYYIVYLFSENMESVYLTLGQGVKETSKEEMKRIKEEIRTWFPDYGRIKKDDLISLGNSQKAKQYALSTAAYIRYTIDEMPSEATMVSDLKEMIRIYEQYIESKNSYVPDNNTDTTRETETNFMNDKELVEHIYTYIQSKGFHYQREEVVNLFLSLKTKPFVILSGISGTGKTKMVQWFAESVGATEENGQFALIPIRPDWNDGSDLLGYLDIKGEFKKGPLTKVIERANEKQDLPFFVLLDEMNLARVEYYFSDILSVMESRKWKNGQMVSSNLLTEETAGENIKLPNNLYIIGTVNMDETTHPFSKKVLDRANTIEFNRVELGNLDFLSDLPEADPAVIGHESFASNYLHLKDVYQKHKELVVRATEVLERINSSLQLTNAHVGYRVRDEICFYLAYSEEGGLLQYEEALDHCILQKVLPRIAGSDGRVNQMLRELYTIFTNKQWDENEDRIAPDLSSAKYPRSAAKVTEMLRRLREDGFTSFWIS